MSRALYTLLRIYRTAIEDASKIVADYVAQRAENARQIEAIQSQLQAEILAAMGDPLAASMLPGFTQQMRARIAALCQRDAILECEEDRARDRLAAAYLEEKKIEHLIEAVAQRDEQEKSARDAQLMDELAIISARTR